MKNRNQQILEDHLAHTDPEEEARRIRQARELAVEADKRRISTAIVGVLFGPALVAGVLVAAAWILAHLVPAIFSHVLIVGALGYVVTTLGLAWWSGGFFSALRAAKHAIMRSRGSDKPSYVPLPAGKERAAIASSVMFFAGWMLFMPAAAAGSQNAAAMTLGVGMMVILTPMLIGSVYAWSKYGSERRLAAAGYSSEVEAYHDSIRRNEEGDEDLDQMVQAHLANMGPPRSTPAYEDAPASGLPDVRWDDEDGDSPLRPA